MNPIMPSSEVEQEFEEGADPVEPDDGGETVTQPFDPKEIRIETKVMTIDLLLRRIARSEIDLTPDFQRASNLWKLGAQSRLLESLLIRIPIPGFYMDATDDERWLVVDGLQRLTALNRYVLKKDFALTGLEFLPFHGKRFDELPRPMQRRIEETQVTVYLIQPGTPSEVKFNLFKRINTGGLPLSAQEIRHALNQGPAAEMLKRMALEPHFVAAVGRYLHNQRMTDRECALRFLAFILTPPGEYSSGEFDSFLNDMMKRLNQMTDVQRSELEARFSHTMDLSLRLFGNDAFRKRYKADAQRTTINKALFESWAVNLDALDAPSSERLIAQKGRLRELFIDLMNTNRDFVDAISQGTGDIKKVRQRFTCIAAITQKALQ